MLQLSPKKLALLLFPLFFCLLSIAQSKDSLQPGPKNDTAALLNKIKVIFSREAVKSIDKFKAGRTSITQEELLDEIRSTMERVKIYLKSGIDTLGIAKEMDGIRNSFSIARDGVFGYKGTGQTHRNLSVSAAILEKLLVKATGRKKMLDAFAHNLVYFRDRIDSLSSDTTLYLLPADSAGIMKYVKRIAVVAREIRPMDSIMNQSIASVQGLQTQVDELVFELRSAQEDVEVYRKGLSAQTFDREFPNIGEPLGYSRPFNEIIRFSIAKERLAMLFYVEDNKGRLLLLFLLILLSTLFIRSLKERMQQEKRINEEFKDQLVIRYPFLSSLTICLSLFQFFFIDPPFIFGFCFWLAGAISLSLIFRGFITAYWNRFWQVMVILFLLAGLDNFLLQASGTERWLMLGLNIAGIFYGVYIFLGGRWKELRERRIVYFIVFVVAVEIASLVYNVYGRYNFSKALLASGFSGVVIAIIFLWTVRLINEGLMLASTTYRHPDKKLFYINFDRVGNRAPAIFYLLLVTGWIVLVGRNFYAYKEIISPLADFLNKERSLGDYTFTVNGLFLFLVIMFTSVLLSRVTSFFASDHEVNQKVGQKNKKITIGSWILLIRIAIICLGLFLAFAAAGIPLDRITIILGALGVGIGLGLQGLVHNLVSGLIIAFEKPVNVGDFIEIDNKSATMKSIGFRSSVVTLADGACVIIPNGDLLSQHLVNWTMGKNLKRISVSVGVAYGMDLEKVKRILTEILDKDERILKHPAPGVYAKDFNQSSIDFELLFWIHHMPDSQLIKSDIISGIERAFQDEGIVIPFPQQDLHIRSLPNGPANGGLNLNNPRQEKTTP